MAGLLRQSLAHARLREAWGRVRENNGQPGVDGVRVEDFERSLSRELDALRHEVLGARYRPAPLKRLWLPREGKLPRPIGIPVVRDRLLQTAVALTLTPILEGEFEDCSYAYRKGRSVRMAVERIGLLQRQGYHWVVEADIERFFDRIPHARVLDELREIAPDDALLALIAQWLTAPVQDGDRLSKTTLGVPQGSPISPLLANLYLDHLDEALLDEGYALVRYADDFIVLAKSRERAEAAVELSDDVLRDLELRLNPLKTRVVNFDTGFRFLGWHFVRSLAVPAPRAGDARLAATSAENVRNAQAVPQATPPTPEAPIPASPASGALAEAFGEALADNPAWRPLVADSKQPNATESTQSIQGDATPDGHVPQMRDTALDTPSQDWPQADTQAPALDEADALPPSSLQRTLYLVDPAVQLATENRHLLVKRDDHVVLDLPAVNVDQVILLGPIPVTSAALRCCLAHDIPIAHLTRTGKFLGRTEPPGGQAIHLLAAQFAHHASNALDLPLARACVQGKLHNNALLLARYARHRPEAQRALAHPAIQSLKDFHHRCGHADSLEAARGFEGAGAVAYFAVWRAWLAPEWTFGRREARTGADPVNALLDFGYTLLYQSVAGLIRARGLNPWLGHLHRPSPGHMALASDLMEEFRAVVVDAVVFNLLLNRLLAPGDFVHHADGHTLRPEAARFFVREIETKLNSELQHPHTGERLDMRRILDSRIRALVHAYRSGDPASFRPCQFK